MRTYEYLAVPAPTTGIKAKGAKSTSERFAVAMTDAINEMAAEGWQYVRAETLPCEERKGLTGTQTSFQNVLIFRRELSRVGAAEEAPVVKAETYVETPEEAVDDEPSPVILTERAYNEGEEGDAPRLGGARRDA